MGHICDWVQPGSAPPGFPKLVYQHNREGCWIYQVLRSTIEGTLQSERLYLQAEPAGLVVGVGQAIELEAAEHKPQLARLARVQGC